ncbi:MAG: alternative splicing regulator-domain-containing protein [Benjaminiella poitrasii]|nr:MAG: alternative splicing regulator-domain-containing protein [Benjaminiella poitrasii]
MIPSEIIKINDKGITFAHKNGSLHTSVILCFIPGFMSDFATSKKAQMVYDVAKEHDLGFLSWNHKGMSSVVDWYRDGLSLLCDDNSYYFIGASMGLWISLLIAGASSSLDIRGIIGIGGSIDFTERWLTTEVIPKNYVDNDVWRRPSEYTEEGYYEIPISFLLNSRPALLMSLKQQKNPLLISCPIWLIHGAQDKDVTIQEAKEIANYLSKRNYVYFYQIKDGDHRLSRSQDLDFVGIFNLIKKSLEKKINKKIIRELMADHRKRAERRRAFYESRLGDPQQLIRVIGSSSKLYPDAEQFYYHENPDNLMPWQGNPDIKIDRFDGRSLLEYMPESNIKIIKNGYRDFSKEDREMSDELNFERYHDLIEAERLNVTEAERLAEIEEEWTKLLDRHQAKLALLKNQESNNKNGSFGYDYGTGKISEEELYQDNNDEKASRLLKDILLYIYNIKYLDVYEYP